MPAIQIYWHNEGSETLFKEKHLLPRGTKGKEWAKALLDEFNANLRPGELPRLVKLVVVTHADRHAHDWRKASLVTEAGGYDRYRCEHCGATAKRFTLAGNPRPDDKKGWGFCEDEQERQPRKR